jgi:hypothetical protein
VVTLRILLAFVSLAAVATAALNILWTKVGDGGLRSRTSDIYVAAWGLVAVLGIALNLLTVFVLK